MSRPYSNGSGNGVPLVPVILALLLSPVVAAQPDSLPLLTPEEATALVLARNPAVATARLDAAIAENDASLGNAGFLPTVGLTLSQRRFPGRGGDAGPFGGTLETNTLDLTAGAELTLFEGLARVARYRRLQALAEAQALDTEATAEALLADALVVYFDVAQQQQRLVVLREAVALSEERRRIAEGRFGVGAASELEVRRALVDLNADRAALLRQEAALAQAKALLNRLLNREDSPDYRVVDSVAVDAGLELDVLLAAAAEAAPDLAAAEVAVRAAELQATAIRREFWPRIGLAAGYAFGALTDPLLAPGQPGGFTYGLTATFDVFEGNNRRRLLENARLRARQQRLAVEAVEVELVTALRGTHALYVRSLQLVALERENVEAARQNAAVALERFRLGASTSLELREVQRALIDAESRLVTARFEAKAAEIDLLALSGLLLPEPSGAGSP